MPRASMCQTRKPRCSAWGQRGLCDAGLCGLQWVRACVWTAIRSCECRRPQFDSWVREIPWRRDRLPTPVFLGFPCSSAGKESAGNAGDQGLIPGLGRSPREGKSYPCQYSSLEKSRDYTVHGVAKSQTRLSDFHFTFHPTTTFY